MYVTPRVPQPRHRAGPQRFFVKSLCVLPAPLCVLNARRDTIQHAMESPAKRSQRFDIGAGWLLVGIGTFHSLLTFQQPRETLPQRTFLLAGGVLMVLAGVTSITGAHTGSLGIGRASHALGMLANATGVLLSLVLLWRAPGTPQALPLLMVFAVSTVLTLLRPPW